jgi:hypothetical protein
MSDDSTSEDLARYRELSANSAAAYARYAEMRAQDLERELRSGRFQYSSAGDEARSVVKVVCPGMLCGCSIDARLREALRKDKCQTEAPQTRSR